MKFQIIFLALLFISYLTIAQDKGDVVKYGIISKKNLELNIAEGDKSAHIEKEEFFNSKGELIEVKEFKDKGKTLVQWYKYKYDSNGIILEELELNAKGEQKERVEHKYKDGLRSEKLYYDSKDRLSKRKNFVYEFRK